ncbi:MAG TPA: prepilin-type N-terminal cleavage/methylation domain-containing protein [Gemmatimonadaceae bacterium]
MRARRGFTLVELLVAVVILNVGLLALVGGSAALVRRHAALRARSVASRTAAAGLARLAVSPCGATSGSVARSDGGTESWFVDARDHRVRDIADSVTYAVAGGQGTVALHSRAAC